jgi:hypothetical protein
LDIIRIQCRVISCLFSCNSPQTWNCVLAPTLSSWSPVTSRWILYPALTLCTGE